MQAQNWRRFAAPAAFLLAATIAVVLVRAGFEAGSDAKTTTSVVIPTPRKHVVTTAVVTTRKTPARRFWVVQAGDTFAVISEKTGVPAATLARLNPHVHSTSLFIGERIRLR